MSRLGDMTSEVMDWDGAYREQGVFEGRHRGISVSRSRNWRR
ncbi:hypothetical protein BZL30_3531 [Mycobacterium kansasii]|uniref:Uncharacterized protein n=1 Tax=Mycobacterium kansasii TaxID=1768 RepID=A0A1V3X868_MYCKA|nr:hypothetical protein BZL30_3531 [Mycobacterium kansasii]